MDETAQLILDKLSSLDRRISRLEELVLPSPPIEKSRQLNSFQVQGSPGLMFHYTVPGYADMENVLNQLIGQISPKSRGGREINVYAEFASGRPSVHINGSHFKSGFKILLLIAPPKTAGRDWGDLYKSYNYDGGIIIELDGSFKRIDLRQSDEEIRRFRRMVE